MLQLSPMLSIQPTGLSTQTIREGSDGAGRGVVTDGASVAIGCVGVSLPSDRKDAAL